MANEFFPLRPGARLEYETRSLSGSGRIVIETLGVSEHAGVLTARCRRTAEWGGAVRVREFEVVEDGCGVRSPQGLVFPLPIRAGEAWEQDGETRRVESLDAEVSVPAGTFTGCLRIVALIAGGDGGAGESLFAPGVGLVFEARHDEIDPYSLSLTSAS